MPRPVDHQVALAGEPLCAVLALEGLGELPVVTGEAGRREVHLATRLVQHNWGGSLCYLVFLQGNTKYQTQSTTTQICISIQYISNKKCFNLPGSRSHTSLWRQLVS